MEIGIAGELLGLFGSAFLSATILPGASEASLALVLAKGQSAPAVAIGVATLGNTLGSAVNWAIGRFFSRFRDHPRFPMSRERYDRTVATYRRWGVWSLLLSWVPIVGDPLTVIAGVLRTPLPLFLAVVGIAKGARYLLLAGIVGALWP